MGESTGGTVVPTQGKSNGEPQTDIHENLYAVMGGEGSSYNWGLQPNNMEGRKPR